MSLPCCFTDDETPFCDKRRFDGLPMCKKHMHETFRAAIWDALLPWDVVRKLVEFTGEVATIRRMSERVEVREEIRFREMVKENRKKYFSVVYYVRLSGGRIKIGRTSDIPERMKALRARNEDVLAIEPGNHEVETKRHRQFADLRHGRLEDFDESPELLAHIVAVREKWPTLQDGWLAA